MFDTKPKENINIHGDHITCVIAPYNSTVYDYISNHLKTNLFVDKNNLNIIRRVQNCRVVNEVSYKRKSRTKYYQLIRICFWLFNYDSLDTTAK